MGVSESMSIIRGDISSGGGRRWDERDGVLVSRDGVVVAVTLLDNLMAAAVADVSSQEEEEEERRWRVSGEVAVRGGRRERERVTAIRT